MEAIALLGLSGLAYLVARSTNNIKRPGQEGFQESSLTMQSTPNIPRGPPGSPLVERQKGATAQGFSPDLDMMYKTPNGQEYPSEPVPGHAGMPYQYASKKSVRASRSDPEGVPMPSRANVAQVELNSQGIEYSQTSPDSGTFINSDLTGESMPASEFRHNNMVPFFGGRVKQNVDSAANTQRLDIYTGAGTTQINKKEIEPMFDYLNTPFGNPFGMEDNTDFVQSRLQIPRNRQGERPFDPTHVGPAIEEKFGITGKGGFQQIEINEYMMKNIPRTDDLRVKTNPKLSYEGVAVPGVHFVGKPSEDPGDVRKNRPDTFYIDQTGERFFTTTGDLIKEAARPTQIINYTTRPETSVEYSGIAASQEAGDSYVAGTYRTPLTQSYGGAGFRNADMTEYYTPYVDGPEADYGKSSIEIRPNERLATTERVVGLNLTPAEAGATMTHYDDPSRPTRRSEIVGNIRQTGTPVMYEGGAPKITVWDPDDVARTTVKEGTVNWNLYGIAGPGEGPEKLIVYDPDDIAKPTQKSQLSKRDYWGAAGTYAQDLTSHVAAYNMRLNPNKQQIARGRKPIAGNGNVAVFTGDIKQTTRKLNTDYINSRGLSGNRQEGLPPGVGDIGDVRYRVPLKLDVSMQRNQRETILSVENNPLMQSLQKNAQRDDDVLKRMLGSKRN
jgi:hypothetical protein